MWENETAQVQATDNKAQGSQLFTIPKCNEKDGIIIVQAAICAAIIIFVLLSRAISTPFFQQLKEQYAQIMHEGIDLSGQGELIRFINGLANGIRQQAQEVLNSLDESKTASGGAQEGSAISYTPTQALYRLSVNPFTPITGALTSNFGERINPVTKAKEFHAGTDLAAPKGSKVFAAFSGKVEKIGYDKIRGNFIILRHTNNLLTIYQHLEKSYLKIGDSALRGQIIGLVGSTGLSTGYHLHFEIIINTFSVNPERVLYIKK